MDPLPLAKQVVERLVQAGHIAYFAGGWVRDYLLNHPSDDIDIATSASVEQVRSLFDKTVPVGIAFGIVIVVEQGHPFEVATFRKESGYLDGRRPTAIEPASAQEDAARRDFTINGLFWDPLKEEIYDFVGGREDLQKGIIKAIGDPHERFLEDRLRMMRAVRYSTRFGFPIEDATAQAILEHAPTLLPAVAKERVWQEFKKMSAFSHFDRALILLHEMGLLSVIFPSLKNVSINTLCNYLEPLAHVKEPLPAIAELIELFPQMNLDELSALCDDLKLSRQERECACFFHQTAQLLNMPIDWLENLEAYQWAVLYAHPDSPAALAIATAKQPLDLQEQYKKTHQIRQQKLHGAIERLRSKNPVLRAGDLMEAGVKPGKRMGALLKEGERLSVNCNLDSADEIIAMLKNSSLWNSGSGLESGVAQSHD